MKIHIPLPIEGDVLELPGSCIISGSNADVVFVQRDPAKAEYTAQRVNVAPFFSNDMDFVWSKPGANGEGTAATKAGKARLPLKPITQGTRLVQNGVDELWRILKARKTRRRAIAATDKGRAIRSLRAAGFGASSLESAWLRGSGIAALQGAAGR